METTLAVIVLTIARIVIPLGLLLFVGDRLNGRKPGHAW